MVGPRAYDTGIPLRLAYAVAPTLFLKKFPHVFRQQNKMQRRVKDFTRTAVEDPSPRPSNSSLTSPKQATTTQQIGLFWSVGPLTFKKNRTVPIKVFLGGIQGPGNRARSSWSPATSTIIRNQTPEMHMSNNSKHVLPTVWTLDQSARVCV